MSNSFISSLAALDVSSVTNTSSLFFFGQSNDSPRLVSAAVLETAMGMNLGTFVRVASSTTSIIPPSTSASSFDQRQLVPYDVAVHDDLGQFDSNSVGLITMQYAGWVQVHKTIAMLPDSSATDTANWFSSVLKNGTPVYAGEYWDGSYYNAASGGEYRNCLVTAPFTVAIGDTITAQGAYKGIAVLLNSGSFVNSAHNWLWVKPLAITAWS